MNPNYQNEHHHALVDNINWNIQHMKELNPEYSAGNVSDGHHTFNELYDHRAKLFLALCRAYPWTAWRSKKRHDNETDPMFDSMFIVGINTPDGPVTYHCDVDPYWDLFEGIATYERAPKPHDGCTPEEGIERLKSLERLNGWRYLRIRNEFTEVCDKHLINEFTPEDIADGICTELWVDTTLQIVDHCMTVPFRFPGATRGHITIKEGSCKILEVKFYPETTDAGIGCYKKSVLQLEESFKDYYITGDTGLLIRACLSPTMHVYMDSKLRAEYGGEGSR